MSDDIASRKIAGFYEFHADNYGHRRSVADLIETSINAAGGAGAVDYGKIKDKFSQKQTRLKTLMGYTSRVVPTYQMLELFRDSREGAPRGRVLDIGCGRGIHLRLLKGWGHIDEAVGIDVYDHCTGFDEASLERLHRRFRLLRFAEPFQDRIARKPRETWTEIDYAIIQKIPTVRRFAADYGHRPDKGIYDLRMKRRPHMDRFIAGNVFELQEKFDIVTSFASMDWFSADEIMGKIASMLNDGGHFYVWVTNWWHAISTANIFGHFPFAAQRFTKEDFERYVAAEMPEHRDTILKSYSYFDKAHPTIADLVEIGSRHGLVPVSWKQNILPDHARPRGGISSLGVSQLDHGAFEQAYDDARGVDPDLRQIDMYPYSNSILFQKVNKASHFSVSGFDSLKRSLTPPARTDNPAVRFVKSIGSRIFQ